MNARSLWLGLLAGVIASACKREEARDHSAPPPSPPAQAVSTTPMSIDTGPSGWESLETERLSGVQYALPTQVLGVIGVKLPDEYFDSIGPGYKIGTFVEGKYRGADLVSAEWQSDEPCKGEGCDEIPYLRFVKARDTLVFLPQNSDGGSYVRQQQAKWQLWTGAFSAAGLTLVSDSQFAVRAFLPTDTILHGSDTFRLVSRRCNPAPLRVAFRHPFLQRVRFDGELFYVTRPDGSCLTFECATIPSFPPLASSSTATPRSWDIRHAASPCSS